MLPLLIAQMAKNAPQIILWVINSSLDSTTSHQMNFTLDTKNVASDIKCAFDSDSSLFLAHATGIWHVNISFQKKNERLR